jgi:glycosyltransferase involved in cell wall biosynthesis
MKIALLGTRGIPANYGGFETFAEQLSVRLAARGHEVTVYCRTNNVGNVGPIYRGVRLALLPTIAHKYFDTLAHTFLSTLHLALHRCDVALYCNGANAIFTPLPRLLGMPTVLNVDGLERQRRKWNALARGWYRLSERLSTWFPSAVVSDARVIQRYYAEQYGKQTRFIAYGAEAERVETTKALEQWGLQPGEYFLYVSRMEPENNALLVVRAFEQARTGKKLVMVGDAPYAADYIRQVKQTADPRILFTGAVYGQGYSELQSHCFAYVHATEVGGTHPALIEAMGRACVVLYLDTPENREVAGEVGFAFHKEEAGNKEEAGLAAAIESVDGLPEERRRQIGSAALEFARSRYDWDAVVEEYERLFESLLRR